LALVAPSAGVSVAPITLALGRRARIRATPSCIAACTASTVALPFLLKSLMPSSQITCETPESVRTSRSRRASAEGPPGKGFCGEYSLGPATWLPPIPAFTTDTALP
jgi:hypothetical protein